MLFHTWTFLVFYLVVYLGYLALRGTRWWVSWLLIASYVFYGAWNPYYLLLVLYSTLLDYGVVLAMVKMTRPAMRKLWMAVSIVNNLSVLVFFKYADFMIGNLNALAEALHLPMRIASAAAWMPFGLDYLLPVGISFYTFQSMSYAIDYYRGHLEPERDFIRFATYVSFFPQLVAGPIERASALLPQFKTAPAIARNDFTEGASLFLIGLFKKVALSNYLALYVERIYSQPEQANAPALFLATFCFAWQIYFDFSGYTDMARGIAQTMGFRLMLNFNHPYLAGSLTEFWGRWHISLSTWFRDYVYIPLGGNRLSNWLTYRNLLIVFLVSGLWHGANWTFLIWGGLHGLGLVLTRAFGKRLPLPKVLCQILVFLFVCLSWVYFRAESLDQAHLILRRLFTTPWTDPQCPYLMLALVLAVWVYQALSESRFRPWLEHPLARVATAFAMLAYLPFCSAGGGDFIYFQF